MAKVTKKISKRSKNKAKKPKVEKPVESMAPIPEGMISLNITETDLVTFTNLMTIVSKTFEHLAIKALEENDMASFKTLQARFELSKEFAHRLVDYVKMPEPVSRDMH